MNHIGPRKWNLIERFFQLEADKLRPNRKKSNKLVLEHLEPRWNPSSEYMTTFQFDIPASVANLGVYAGVYSNTDSIYLDPTSNQFQSIQVAGNNGGRLPLITLVKSGTNQDTQFKLNIPYPGGGTYATSTNEFVGGELIIFVGEVNNGLPIGANGNKVGAPTAAANPSTNVPPDNYAQIELTYNPPGNSNPGLDIDSSSVDNVGFPFTLTYPTSGLGATGFPLNPLGITLSQQNLYDTFNNLVSDGTIPQEFQQSSTFNQQQDSKNIQIIAPGDILSHNATAPTIQKINLVNTPGDLDANFQYFYAITAYSENVIESYDLNIATGVVTEGTSGGRGETILISPQGSGLLTAGNSPQINWSPYLDPNTAGYNIYRYSTTDTGSTADPDAVYNLIAQIPNNQLASVTVSQKVTVSSFAADAPSLTATSIAGLSVGMQISGTGIAPNTFIQSFGVNNPNKINLTVNTIGVGGGSSNTLTASTLQFTDTGSIPQAQQISASSASSYGFNSLSEYYTEELLGFFGHYLTPNSFALTRSNVQWLGNTVLYAPGGDWNTSGSIYMALQLTAQNADGPSVGNIQKGDVLNVYAPFFQTNTRNVTLSNGQSTIPLPPMPSWLSGSSVVNGVLTIGSLYESPSEMVFGCDSVFASNAVDPDVGHIGPVVAGSNAPGTELNTYLGSIEDSISAAFNRGIATDFSIQPDNWASFPSISSYPIVSTSTNSQANGPGAGTYYYAVTAVNVLGESPPGLVVPATLQAGDVATINWTQNTNPVPPSTGFNIYRGTTNDISKMGLLISQTATTTVDGFTLAFTDDGTLTPSSSIHPPVQYFAKGSTSNWYAYFTQTNSSLDPVNGVSINGLAYGFAYADQGGLSTNAFFTPTPLDTNGDPDFPEFIGVNLGTISGPNFITPLLPDAIAGQSYSQQLQISGKVDKNSISYTLNQGSSLPSNLTLSTSGLISGTPTTTTGSTPASFTISVKGTENGSQFEISKLFTLEVDSAPSTSNALSITGLDTSTNTLTLQPISQGVTTDPYYTRTITVSGGTDPYTLAPTANIGIGLFTQFPLHSQTPSPSTKDTFSLNTISPSDYVTNGVNVGLNSITFNLTDSATTPNTLTFQLNTEVLPALTITPPTTTPTAWVGVPYYQKITTNQTPAVPQNNAAPSVPPYPWGEVSYSLASGSSLPDWLTLTPFGVLQGTPTGTPETVTFSVQAKNNVTGIAETATASFTIDVQGNSAYKALTISNSGTLLPVIGTTYNAPNFPTSQGNPLATITATGGSGNVQIELINGYYSTVTNPGLSATGLSFDGANIIGTANTNYPGDYPVTFRAIDDQGHTAYQNVTISVLGINPPPIPPAVLGNGFDLYEGTTTLVIAGNGFDANNHNNNALTVTIGTGSSQATTIKNTKDYTNTLDQLVATELTLATTGSLNLSLQVNNGTAITSNGYATIQSTPSINLNRGNLAQNASTLTITGSNFGSSAGERYFINATKSINATQLVLTDSSNNNVPYTSIGNGDYSTTMELQGLDLSGAALGALTATLVVNGDTISFNNSEGILVSSIQVASIVGTTAPPTVNLNANQSLLSNGLEITGTGFNPTTSGGGTNTVLVTFTTGSNTYTYTTSTVSSDISLTIPATVFTNQGGVTNATVSVNGIVNDGGTVQVANFQPTSNSIVGPVPNLTFYPTSTLNENNTFQLPINGYGFTADSLKNNLELYYSTNQKGNQPVNDYSAKFVSSNLIIATINAKVVGLDWISIGPTFTGTNGIVTFVTKGTGAVPSTAPSITTSTNGYSAANNTLTINGSNFGTTGNNFVTLTLGTGESAVQLPYGFIAATTNAGPGFQNVTANPDTDQLTVTLAGPLPSGDIYATVSSYGISSGIAIKVATVPPIEITGPTITSTNPPNISPNPTLVIINGKNFSTTGNNVLTLSQGTVVSVTANSAATQLVAVVEGITTTTTPVALNATVVANGVSTGSPVTIATVQPSGPDIQFSVGPLSPSATKLVIAGSNFGAEPTDSNTVTLYSQTGEILTQLKESVVQSVAANSANQLTVTLANGVGSAIPAGQLYATVSVNNGVSTTVSDTVQVAYITPYTLPAPSITPNPNNNLSQSATTLVITGFNFDQNGTNILTLTDSTATPVTFPFSVVVNSSTQITVSFTTPPINFSGALFAVVETDGLTSGTPPGTAVQVATVGSASDPATQVSLTPPAGRAASGSASGAAFITQPVIAIKDAFGNTVTDSTASVTMTVSGSDGKATTVGTTTVNAVNGSATFTNVGISGTTGQNYTLTFASGSLTSATQTITPTFGAATQVTLTTSAAGSTSGSAFTTQPVLTIKDAFGNTVTDSTASVTMAVSGGDNKASLVGTTSVNAVAGVATFSNVGISGTAGTAYTLTFTSGSLPSVTESITPTFGTATQVALTTPAAGSVSGSAFTTQPVIAIQDAFGNTVTDSTASVTMTVSPGATTVGTTTVNAVAGVATFTGAGISGTPGTEYTLFYSSGVLDSTIQPITTALAPSINKNSNSLYQTASSLKITGTNFDKAGTNVLTLTNNNVPVLFNSSTVDSSEQITVTFGTQLTNITGDLFAVVVTDGQSSGDPVQVANVVASTTAPTITPSTTNNILANATSLTIKGSGFDTTIGGSNGVLLSSGVVTKVAVVNSSQLTVTLDPQFSLLTPGQLLATVTVNGVHSNPANVQVANVLAVPVVTPGGALLPANATTLTIQGTGFSTTATNTVAFSSGTGTVTNSTATALTVQMNSAPTAGPLTATVTSDTVSSGAAVTINTVQPVITTNTALIDQQTTKTLTISGVGFDTTPANNSVTLSSGAGSITNATSTALTVQFSTRPEPGELFATVISNGVASNLIPPVQVATVVAQSLSLATYAAGAVNGQPLASPPVIQFLDSLGNKINDNTTVVTMAVSDGAFIIGSAQALAINGLATFAGVGIDGTLGQTYTLIFTAPNFQPTYQSITISPNSATQVGISNVAKGASSGSAFTTQPSITILDAKGHLVNSDSTSQVTMSVSSGATTIGNVTLKAVNGVVNFSNVGISGNNGVPYTLTFSSGGLTAATQTITINPGSASQVSVFTPANGAENNTPFTTQPVIKLLDFSGNPVTTDNTTQVTVSVNFDGKLIGTITESAQAGVVTFTDVGINGLTGANYILTYSANGLTSAQQNIQLAPYDNPTKLGIVIPAIGANDGDAFTTQPIISFQNNSGSEVPSGATVTMTVSNGATIVGSSTAIASNGLATFSGVGISGTPETTYTLTFSSPNLTSVTQTIVINALVPSQIGFSTQAAGASDGRPFVGQPVLSIQDSSGVTVATDNTTSVTMSVSNGATTLGITTQTAVNGKVTFTDVGIEGVPNTNYTLTFASKGLASATQTILLNPGLATHLNFSTFAAGAASGSPFTTQPSLQILDAFNQVVTTDSSMVTLQVSPGATLVGTTTVKAVNGFATFTDVGISGTAGTTYTLSFTSGVLLPDFQSITPTFGAATQVALTSSAAGAASGAAFTTQPSLTIKDAFGNTVTDSSAAVTIAVSGGDGKGTLVGASSVNAVNGIATFSGVGISGTAGTEYTLTFASTGLTGATQNITPSFGAATQVTLAPSAAGAASGAAFTTQPSLTIKDAFGNTVTDSSAAVTMAVSGNGTTVGTTTVNAVNGIAKFSDVGISGTAGTEYTLTFASTGLTSAIQSITPTFGAATQVSLSTQAEGALNGRPFEVQPVVTVKDAFGNTVGNSTVEVTIATSGANVIGAATVNAVNGVATFTDVGLQGGSNKYTLTYSSGVLTSATQSIDLKEVPAPLVTGTTGGSSQGSTVNIVDQATGQVISTVVPFPGFMGEVRVASGDLDGDGKMETIAAAGSGGGPAVNILDSSGKSMGAFFAYDEAFRGGIYISVSDVNNDGFADIITGAGEGGGPHVKIFNGKNLQELESFFAYAEDFRGGVSVASVDFNGDRILDVVTGAGPGGGPHVKVFDGATLTQIGSWFAYAEDFRGGVFVAIGDIGNDGQFEVVTGAGIGGGPVVAVFTPTGVLQTQFFAYAEDFRGGVRVGVIDGNDDGVADLVTGAGPGGGPHVKGFNYPNLDLLFQFFDGPEDNTGGVFVS